MSDQPRRKLDSEQRDTLLATQAPSNLEWHQDALRQRKLRQLQRRAQSPFIFPAWSIALMLLVVMAAAAAIAFGVYSLRAGRTGCCRGPGDQRNHSS